MEPEDLLWRRIVVLMVLCFTLGFMAAVLLTHYGVMRP